MIRYTLCLLLLTAFVGTAGVAPALAQNNLRSDRGYLDLNAVDQWFDAEPYLEVNIKGALLNLITEASRSEEDPELTGLLSNLRAIEVRGYRMEGQMFEDIDRRTGDLARELESQGWETVVRIREDSERVNVYLMPNGNTIAGLVVMVLDPSDDDGAMFVNIVGDIDPAQIGRLGQKFNIDPLSSIPGSR